MSEQDQDAVTVSVDPVVVDERTLLMQRADQLGVSYSGNIGTEKLRERIAEKLKVNEEPDEVVSNGNLSKAQIRSKLLSEARKLIRVRITCMDPTKADLQGEIFTVANSFIGTIRKFIPYGAFSENGYHIEKALLDNLKTKTFSEPVTKYDERGRPFMTKRTRKYFAIQELPALTQEELDALADDQRVSGRV